MQVQIFNPAFFKYIHDHWTRHHGRYPSTGMLVLFFALHVCDEVSLFHLSLSLTLYCRFYHHVTDILKIFPSGSLPVGECLWFWGRQSGKLAPLLGAKPLFRRVPEDRCPRRGLWSPDHPTASQGWQNHCIPWKIISISPCVSNVLMLAQQQMLQRLLTAS